MLGVVGTIPDSAFPITHGPVGLNGDMLTIEGSDIPVNRGTPALLAAALKTAETLQRKTDIYAFLVGDIGLGEGSRELYAFLERHVAEFDLSGLTFHYLQPDADWHNKVLFAIDDMKRRPFLIADAGFMYAAKMSGQAGRYDFFTPDVGELAFLADEMAPHPFYTRGFILHRNDQVPEWIQRAYQHRNAAAHLLVKGKTDYIVREGQIADTVTSPSFEAMEAIGGTGDMLTGILSVLCGNGFPPEKAAVLAAQTNRLTGKFSNPTPASQIMDLIEAIPQALEAGDV